MRNALRLYHLDPNQSNRFLETAEAAQTSDNPDDFDWALKKIAPYRGDPKPSRKFLHIAIEPF